MNRLGYTLIALLTVVSLCRAKNPDLLDNVQAYTTEISDRGPTTDYFPVGVLLKQKGKLLLTRSGLNYNEYNSAKNYRWKYGKPMADSGYSEPCGTLQLQPIWGLATLHNGRKTNDYGTLPMAENHTGKKMRHSSVSLFDANVRKFITEYDAAAAKEWGKRGRDDLLIWALDNEWEGQLDYSKPAVDRFHQYLKQTYGTIDKLNAIWKTEYEDFSQIVPPAPEAQIRERHGAWLDWHRFHRLNFTDLVVERFKAVKNSDPLHRPVVLKTTQLCTEVTAKSKHRLTDPATLAERTRELSDGYYGVDIYGADDRLNYDLNYLFNCIRPLDRKPGFGVLLCETNNHSSPAYQWASTFWRSLNNGLKGVNFFCAGFPGATRDFDTYAFIDPASKLREKFFYLARYAHMIHRTEAFWTHSIPAPGQPKLAMLMPKRDVLLADDPQYSVWEWSTNNRLKVYTWLRQQGFWVDILPYTKLDAGFLKDYQALVMVGAEHLSLEECGAIKEYVKDGGKLVSDTRPGHFDQHHAEIRALEEVIGARITHYNNTWADLWLATDRGVIRGDGLAKMALTTGRSVVDNTRSAPTVILNKYGQGTSLYFATQLGVLRAETVEPMLVSNWLKGQLAQIGIVPAYDLVGTAPSKEAFRVTQPYVDSNGNCAFAVTNMSTRLCKATTLEMWLPEGTATKALWAPAEEDGIYQLKVAKNATGKTTIRLPEFKTAGMVYLLKKHKVVLGIPQITSKTHSVDGFGAAFKPGDRFKVTVQVCAPERSSAGTLQLQALEGWSVTPAQVKLKPKRAGKIYTCQFQVRVPTDAETLKPQQLYPLVATWRSDQEKAVISANVEVMMPTETFDKNTAQSQRKR
jgi:hypothetical protein